MEAPTTTTLTPDGVPVITASNAPVVDKGAAATDATKVVETPSKEAPVSTTPDESTTSIDDFQSVIDAVPSSKSKEELKKEELKKEDVPAKEEKKVTTTTEQPPKPKEESVKTVERSDGTKVVARDYLDVPAEVKPLLERMSNEAFNYFKPLVLELPKLQKKLTDSEAVVTELKKGRPPENYQEHPLGYILSPEFSKAANDAKEAEIVYNH
jgi:hypothetical protein